MFSFLWCLLPCSGQATLIRQTIAALTDVLELLSLVLEPVANWLGLGQAAKPCMEFPMMHCPMHAPAPLIAVFWSSCFPCLLSCLLAHLFTMLQCVHPHGPSDVPEPPARAQFGNLLTPLLAAPINAKWFIEKWSCEAPQFLLLTKVQVPARPGPVVPLFPPGTESQCCCRQHFPNMLGRQSSQQESKQLISAGATTTHLAKTCLPLAGSG